MVVGLLSTLGTMLVFKIAILFAFFLDCLYQLNANFFPFILPIVLLVGFVLWGSCSCFFFEVSHAQLQACQRKC